MTPKNRPPGPSLASFQRQFFDPDLVATSIGSGSPGGKAQGLLFIREALAREFRPGDFPEIPVDIPAMAVIRTDVFEEFMRRNSLQEIAASDEPDERIAHAFQRASFPAEFTGDLLALVSGVHTPLAVRSSSLLEDSLHEPFAGIYATKMIPNNQPEADTRFRKLMEAIKFVYASTFFRSAKSYRKATGHGPLGEKMAVIIQEVVGHRRGPRFYPEVSGVARSFNFYPTGGARPEDGVVNLALGLGKTIVDGETSWAYSPARPKTPPPFGSFGEWLKQTQTEFWAVNMGRTPAFDPLKETEYLIKATLADAELDGTLQELASTYNPQSERIDIGVADQGARILAFAQLLVLNEPPLNPLVKNLLHLAGQAYGSAVEIEFALTLNPNRYGFLQVRPMVVPEDEVEVGEDELKDRDNLVSSEKVLGNGKLSSIRDIVYVKPESFEAEHTRLIARELEFFNHTLAEEGRNCLLIGFGRWGSSDPWLGIPVDWGQISQAKALVEATLPRMNVELSQGAHFFHNLTGLRVFYFSVHHEGTCRIDWAWLNSQEAVAETSFVRRICLDRPLHIKVDGRRGKGVIRKSVSEQP